jgi:O-antigen/teichoic acid export membrane protein
MLRDLLFYIPSKFVPAALGFAVVIVLSHSLAPQAYGEYVSIVAITRLADALAFAWLRQSILRYWSDYQARGRSREFQTGTLFLLGLVAVVEGLVGSLAMLAIGYTARQVGLMLCVLLPFTVFNYFTTLYQARRVSEHYAIVALSQGVVQMLWILGFVYWARKGYSFALLAVGAGYVSGVAYVLTTTGRSSINLRLTTDGLDWRLFRRLLDYGVPMSFWLLSFQLTYQASRLVVRSMRSASEVGVYASAYDLINGSLSLLMTPFLLAAHPVIMEWWAESRERAKIEQLLTRVSRYLLLLVIPIFSFTAALGKDLFVVLGQGYGVEGWVVPVLVAAAFFGQYSMYAHKGLEVAGRTKTMLGVGMFTALLNIALNLLLVGRYGYQASALIALGSYILYTVIVYSFSRQYIKIYVPWDSVLRISLVGGFAGACLWGLSRSDFVDFSNSWVLTVLLLLFSSGLYLAGLTLVGELALERRWLRTSIERYKSGTLELETLLHFGSSRAKSSNKLSTE